VLREQLASWINDERPDWPGATASGALLLNRRGGRLSAKGATNILTAIATDAGIPDDFSPHVLRHCFGTTLVRDGHDLVLVAELMGHARLETTRAYALPTAADRQRAINSLPTDR
jgi:integrase/recombinase XerC